MKMQAILGLAVVVLAANVHAATVAFDSASDPIYSPGGSFNTQNGGSGFGEWVVQNALGDGNFVGSFVSGNDLPSNGAKAWAVFADVGSFSQAVRPLTGGTLAVGQRLTLGNFVLNAQNFATGTTTGNGGFFLNGADGSEVLRVYARGGTNSYFIDDALGNGRVFPGLSYNYQTPNTFVFTPGPAGTYTLSVSGNSTAVTTGTINSPGITSVGIFDANGGASSDVTLRSLSVTFVPEPTALGLVMVSGTALLRRRRSR